MTHAGFCLVLVLAVLWILPEALGRQKWTGSERGRQGSCGVAARRTIVVALGHTVNPCQDWETPDVCRIWEGPAGI